LSYRRKLTFSDVHYGFIFVEKEFESQVPRGLFKVLVDGEVYRSDCQIDPLGRIKIGKGFFTRYGLGGGDIIYLSRSGNDICINTGEKVGPPHEEVAPPPTISLERDLVNFLAADPSIIEEGLTLKGKEYLAGGNRIDLLCIDKNGNFVVVETKKGRASDSVMGQVLRYMGWVKENLATKGESVRGIIILRESDRDLEYALATIPNVQVKYYKAKFELHDKPSP